MEDDLLMFRVSWLAVLEGGLGFRERTYDQVDELLTVLLVGRVVATYPLTEASA